MRLLFPLILLAGAGVAIAAVASAEKKRVVRGVLLDDILTDEEADAPVDENGNPTFIDYEDGLPSIDTCVNAVGQVFTFDNMNAFATEFDYKVYWAHVHLTNQKPRDEYLLNDRSRAFDATTCMFMLWSVENRWVPDQVTNAELAGWKANQDLSQVAPPPFFPQFDE